MFKEVEKITGSSTLETNFDTKISNQELENCDSYIPMTPLKPVSPKMRLICEQQENWISEEGFIFPNNFAQGSQSYSVPARYNPSNSLNITNSFHNWEGSLASGSCPSEFSESQHFGHLRALENAAAPNDFENTFLLGGVTGECSSFFPVYKSQFDSNRYEASSATSSPAIQDGPYGLNLWSNSDKVPDMNLHGKSMGTRFMYDLNYPPTSSTNAFFNENIPSQFAPITPDHAKKTDYRNVIDGKVNQVRDNKGGEIATTRVETVELLDKELQKQSKDLQENHNSDKTDLNKTPQQKPRRRKHRPKVVIEGKPKRTPKSSTPIPDEPKENPMCEKKYVRKNKSCKRAINFDLEAEAREEREVFISKSQAQNFSKVQLGEGFEIMVEKTQMGVAFDLNHSINKVLEEYIAASKIQSINPQTPNKTEQRDSMANGPDNHAKGKCEINFLNETLDKQGSSTTMMEKIENQSPRGLKRGNLLENLPVFPQSWDDTNGFPGMHFPNIYKKKRTEKIYSSGSAMPRTVHAANTSVSSHPTQYLERGLGADQKGKMMKKKRSKVPTRVRDFASLMGIIECGQKNGTINHSLKSIEALVAETHAPMKKKKRTKRLSFTTCTSTGILMKRPSTVDEITELLRHLDINSGKNQERKQQRRELVPFNFQFEDKNALVIYQRDGTVVPYMGVFEPVKKRKPRPKVDLDEETDRVWKLLLENINNEGIDGTDDEKAKWWDDERKVFQGRADSFIARMHLVQGDRRFSPWKGSVLDSVVGVFLTQNVSDHLSSSAFMSLAAKFPLSSESSSSTFDEGRSIVTNEPEVCIFDLEDTVNMQTEKEVMNTSESLGRSCSNENQINNTKSNFLGIFGKGLQIDNSTTSDREAMGKRELDDAFSSQISAGSSKKSGDSSVTQPEPSSNSNYNIVPSFVELLQMAASSQGHFGNRKNLSFLGKENGLSVMEGIECEKCTSEQSGVTAESVSQKMIQRNSNLLKNFLIRQPKDNIQSELEINNVINITTSTEHKEVESSFKAININSGSSKPKGKTGKQKQKEKTVNWDSLRVQAQAEGKKRDKNANTMDSLDWEAVRCADVNEIADTIKERGMNNMLAERIKGFLNRLVKEHGSTDLEWLRDVPPDKAKEYLLSVRGLGLKSVECVRLLTLHHLAFPVDTNVGRIAVRLGWVPLQPLPESLQLHLLELYPVLESIQRYLWPRLCKLDQRTLYELHYQMITFGKVFCTKSKPNCNACPMRGECRHFSSAFASSRLALPGLEEKSIVSANENNKTANQNPDAKCQQLQLPSPIYNQQVQAQYKPQCLPIIEVPQTPEPIIEVPASPELEEPPRIPDIEDLICEYPDEIPTIKLNIQEFAQNLQNFMYRNMKLQEGDVSKALVALTPEAASIPAPKLKNVNRLRTEHSVYELPDSHPLLEGLDKREPDDPCSYLLAIWTPGETASSITPPEGKCSAQEFGKLCEDKTCYSCNSIREANSQTVRGTLLIPCRTAMRGSFPLNGTYFQVNEVFADHDSSLKPIDVPRAWIWNLPRRTVYFGTSIPSIFKGLSTECIQYCFWRGFVCVRGFDQKTRWPRPLMARLHFPASKLPRTRAKPTEKQI